MTTIKSRKSLPVKAKWPFPSHPAPQKPDPAPVDIDLTEPANQNEEVLRKTTCSLVEINWVQFD